MMLQQLLSKQREKLAYYVENLTTQPIYWSTYRKKVVVFGAAPIEQLTQPEIVLVGETGRVTKPEIKLPWKRYIVFSHDPALLTADLKEPEFNKLLSIWVDELSTVVLTEVLADDGVRAVRVNSWASWAARKKLAPTAAKLSAAHDNFYADLRAQLLADLPPHAHSKSVACVRSSTELCSEELQFNAMRGRVVRRGLEKLAGVDCSSLDDPSLPKISICASGGGYRAMVATVGSLIGLEDVGVLDCVNSISGLSGSTWAMASWYSSGMTLRETREAMSKKLSSDFYTKALWPDTMKRLIQERVGSHQELGLADVMGWHLHHHLNRDLPTTQELWNHPRLSEQASKIADGSRPMPIYTAVAHEHQRFRWCEFTPYEVGIAADLNAYIPTWAFGRRFNNGVSADFSVEPCLSLLQATWGSAFCATVDQMFHELDSGGKEPAVQKLMHSLVYEKLEMSEDRLIEPARFNNWTLGQQHAHGDHPWHSMKTCKLMDAGVHANLPFPPLLRAERCTDLIIALDQSSAPDIYSSVSLDIIERWCASESPPLPFPSCAAALEAVPPSTDRVKHSAANGRHCTIIPGDLAKGVPFIVYLPLLRNESYSLIFCPRANALKKGGYCSTFNFQYSSSDVHELSGLTAANIHTVRAELTAVIADVTRQRIALNKARAHGSASSSSA